MCVYACVCVRACVHMSAVPVEAERAADSGAGVAGSCEPLTRVLGSEAWSSGRAGSPLHC